MTTTTVFILKENPEIESRVALTPKQAPDLIKFGLTLLVESGAGEVSKFRDSDFEAAGASVVARSQDALSTADIILCVHPPDGETLGQLKKGATLICLLNPFSSPEWPQQLASFGITALSLEMIPRSTIAQKMDVLSSQANLAGYMAVLVAARHLGRILPLMMTPAGTLAAAKVFVLGAGVAGLQAIATAKRLGARVEAFDTRPVVAEQVQSLGAKFLKIDLGETGQTKDGYASALTPEQLELQRKGLLKALKSSNVIITTAKLFGRPSPTLINKEMLKELTPGSVIVDLAAGAGGNVEGTVKGEVVTTDGGITIIGHEPLECLVASDASQMLGSNLFHLLDNCLEKNEDGKATGWKREDEIFKSCVICSEGKVVHPTFLPKPDEAKI